MRQVIRWLGAFGLACAPTRPPPHAGLEADPSEPISRFFGDLDARARAGSVIDRIEGAALIAQLCEASSADGGSDARIQGFAWAGFAAMAPQIERLAKATDLATLAIAPASVADQVEILARRETGAYEPVARIGLRNGTWRIVALSDQQREDLKFSLALAMHPEVLSFSGDVVPPELLE